LFSTIAPGSTVWILSKAGTVATFLSGTRVTFLSVIYSVDRIRSQYGKSAAPPHRADPKGLQHALPPRSTLTCADPEIVLSPDEERHRAGACRHNSSRQAT
jgi:hypothetical protein